MSVSILSLVASCSLLLIAGLVIGREVSRRWALIWDALNFRDPADFRAQQSRRVLQSSVA